MLQLRFRVIVLAGWLSVLFLIERVHQPINLASFVYVVVAGLVILLLGAPLPADWRPGRWAVAAGGMVVLLKPLVGYQVFGSQIPLTVTELVAVVVTVMLAAHIRASIDEYEQNALQLAVMLQDDPQPFERRQMQMYRELRRARRNGRPFALLVAAPSDRNPGRTIPLPPDLQQQLAQRYNLSLLASAVDLASEGCATIASRDGHFVITLPEADESRAAELAARIQQTARSEFGIEAEVGVAVFPVHELTFRGMLQRAEAQLHKVDRPPRRVRAPLLTSAVD